MDSACRASALAGYKRPKAYFFAEAIPRNPGNGNILRRLLRDAAEAARQSGAAAYRAVAG